MKHLDAAEAAIRQTGRPLNSHELATAIQMLGLGVFQGHTPHKTINARLSVDIARNGEQSRFVRTAHGRFSLREYAWENEVYTKPRVLAPLDEEIKVIQIDKISHYLFKKSNSKLFDVDRISIVESAIDIKRADAEERYDVVQLIPTFVVCQGSGIWKYQRTKRLPEARLHHTWSINFGGHLQSSDFPPLFRNSREIVDLFLMRELYEELEFTETPDIKFLGALYLSNTPLERQHIGLVFRLIVPSGAMIRSLEPGFHINLSHVDFKHLFQNIDSLDSWSRLVLEEVA